MGAEFVARKSKHYLVVLFRNGFTKGSAYVQMSFTQKDALDNVIANWFVGSRESIAQAYVTDMDRNITTRYSFPPPTIHDLTAQTELVPR